MMRAGRAYGPKLLDGLAHDRLRVRFAGPGADLCAAQRLRFRAFRARGSAEAAGIDGDEFDARALHVLVEEIAGGRLLCCFRLLHFTQGREVAGSYSAQFYDLVGLARLAALHPYDVPEGLLIDAAATLPAYLRWALDASAN